MCGDAGKANKQSPSSADIQGTTQTSSGKCCWCEDYSKEISSTSNGNYYDLAEAPGRIKKFAPGKVKYKLFCRLKSREILIEVRFQINRASGGEDLLSRAWGKMLGVNDYWGGKARLVVDDPECGVAKLPIRFSAVEDDGAPHRIFELVPDTVNANARNMKVQVNSKSSSWTMAHEFGHVIGLADEYIADKGVTHFIYYAPDGMNSGYIERIPNGSLPFGKTIMAAVNATGMKDRLFWCIAIEAQALLRQALKRSVKCSIEI